MAAQTGNTYVWNYDRQHLNSNGKPGFVTMTSTVLSSDVKFHEFFGPEIFHEIFLKY